MNINSWIVYNLETLTSFESRQTVKPERIDIRWCKIDRAEDTNETIEIGDRLEIKSSIIQISRTIWIQIRIRTSLSRYFLCITLQSTCNFSGSLRIPEKISLLKLTDAKQSCADSLATSSFCFFAIHDRYSVNLRKHFPSDLSIVMRRDTLRQWVHVPTCIFARDGVPSRWS